jgi:hypothetical protein
LGILKKFTLFNTASSVALRFDSVGECWVDPRTVATLALAVRLFNHSATVHCSISSFEQVYYNFLLEFGFSKDILLVQPQFDSLDEHQDIYRDLTPILNMLACLNWLIK